MHYFKWSFTVWTYLQKMSLFCIVFSNGCRPSRERWVIANHSRVENQDLTRGRPSPFVFLALSSSGPCSVRKDKVRFSSHAVLLDGVRLLFWFDCWVNVRSLLKSKLRAPQSHNESIFGSYSSTRTSDSCGRCLPWGQSQGHSVSRQTAHISLFVRAVTLQMNNK